MVDTINTRKQKNYNLRTRSGSLKRSFKMSCRTEAAALDCRAMPSYFYFMIQACFCLSALALATRKSLRSCNTWCKSRCEVISEDFSRCRLFILCISYKSTCYCNFAHSVHDCEVQTRGQPNHADLSGLSLFGIL